MECLSRNVELNMEGAKYGNYVNEENKIKYKIEIERQWEKNEVKNVKIVKSYSVLESTRSIKTIRNKTTIGKIGLLT